ncbi:hypothetical protein PMAYCL1PPCAC_17407, partial [Pristionchus mayeri]
RQVLSKNQQPCRSSGELNTRECYGRLTCRSCRFKLCLESGMAMENVLFNHGKSDRKANNDAANSGCLVVLPNPLSPEVVVDRVLLHLQRIEVAFEKLRSSKYNPLPNSVNSLTEALSGHSKLSVEYGEMGGWPLDYTDGYTTTEGSFMDEIMKRFRSGLVVDHYTGNRKSWYYSNIIFAIEYFKTFNVFHHLSSNSRRVIAGKMALVCANLSNFCYSIKIGVDVLVNPDGTEPFEGMRNAYPREFEGMTSFIRTLRALDIDDNEYVLLKALLILSPSVDDASSSERALLSNQSESYNKMLFSYVTARRGRRKGPKAYQEMLAMIGTLSHKTKIEKDIIVLYGALRIFTEVCPLLEEI